VTGETNVELRKLRYFLRIVDLGSMGKAGAVFYRSAQLALRHADEGVSIAQRMQITGCVNTGLIPTTISALAMPFFEAMKASALSMGLRVSRLIDPEAQLQNFLVDPPQKELSPTACVAKTVLIGVVKRLVMERK
jgi:hypothetical protein